MRKGQTIEGEFVPYASVHQMLQHEPAIRADWEGTGTHIKTLIRAIHDADPDLGVKVLYYRTRLTRTQKQQRLRVAKELAARSVLQQRLTVSVDEASMECQPSKRQKGWVVLSEPLPVITHANVNPHSHKSIHYLAAVMPDAGSVYFKPITGTTNLVTTYKVTDPFFLFSPYSDVFHLQPLLCVRVREDDSPRGHLIGHITP